MTAVASPPSVHSLPRWNPGDGMETFDTMSAEEVTRMFMPRKNAQRQNASSMPSIPSVSSAILSPPAPNTQSNNDSIPTDNDQGNHVPRKKAARGLWPSSKAEPVSGISNARPQGVSTPSSGQSAASTMNSAMNHNPSLLPSQQRSHTSQSAQNGGRMDQTVGTGEPTAILALLPMTGTFERKQINVPFSPDALRIGRQTNAKTVPTAINGYFDSKVLSRQHAEVWADRSGKIWIRDVKSSNGTFVNGVRLSPENRESEPHELREQDTLELGIDIVSEDQKSIVHHKVSAKVEFAGIYRSSPTTFMDMMHIEPSPGQQYPGDPIGHSLPSARARATHGSMGNNGRFSAPTSLAGGNPNIMGAQRQMNMWMAPITVEQVVRKLTVELKQAKQQTEDLHRTNDFFATLMTLEPGQELPEALHKKDENETAAIAPDPSTQNEMVSPEALSPFSQPPAPPPQQPLPEKPDPSRILTDEVPSQSVKRSETEKPRSPSGSPNLPEPQNGQILSLLEALKTVTEESDSQGDRIKHLELALKREKRAREIAERRADALSGGRYLRFDAAGNGTDDEDAFEPPLDSIELMQHDLPNGHIDEGETGGLLKSSASVETLRDVEEAKQRTEEVDASTARLQARLDLMMKEMDEMKKVMETYKRRAEDAEEGRRSLAEMVENIRAGRHPQNPSGDSRDEDATRAESEEPSGMSTSNGILGPSVDRYGLWTSSKKKQMPNGHATSGNMQRELERTLSTVLQQQQKFSSNDYGRLSQSVPYVSMVGVVIIGVGIMTWLNGWQPSGDR